jgi:hypothetical protein
MKKLVAIAILFGVVNLNAKTTSLYEHARDLRIASQKNIYKRVETKKPLVAKRVLESIDKKYSKN